MAKLDAEFKEINVQVATKTPAVDELHTMCTWSNNILSLHVE